MRLANSTKYLIVFPILVFTVFTAFNVAYAVDNNCGVSVWTIYQLPPILGCIEDRLDALENASSGDLTTASNLGSGSNIFSSEVGNDLQFRSVLGSPDISVTQQANTITVDFNGSASGEANTASCDAYVNGQCLFAQKSGVDLQFKRLTSVDGDLIVTSNSSHVIFNNTVNGESTVCTNLGLASALSEGIYVSDNCNFKKLLEGSNIALSSNGTHVTIAVTGITEDNTVCTNLGTSFSNNEGVYASGECDFKRLGEGTGITMSSNSTHIIITNSLPEVTVCNNVGTGNQLCSGGNVNVDTLIAGTGITITDTTDDWTFASQCANTGTGQAICESSNNINSLIAGNGITIIDTTGDLTITPRYELLCQTTLGSATSSVSCSGFTARKYIYFTFETKIVTNTLEIGIRFNNDAGNNYASRMSVNGAADTTLTNDTECQPSGTGAVGTNNGVIYTGNIYNFISSERKLVIGSLTSGIDIADTTAPTKFEYSCKWDNVSAQITRLDFVRVSGTGNYNTGSVLTIWGYD